MNSDYDTLSFRVDALRDRFHELASLLRQEADYLEKGVLPSDNSGTERQACVVEFEQLNREILGRVEDPSEFRVPSGSPNTLDSLEELLGYLREIDRQRLERDALRTHTLEVCNCILRVIHLQDPNFVPLAECQQKAREICDSLGVAGEGDHHDELVSVPQAVALFEAVLILIEPPPNLDEGRFEELENIVTQALGPRLPIAAHMRKLSFESTFQKAELSVWSRESETTEEGDAGPLSTEDGNVLAVPTDVASFGPPSSRVVSIPVIEEDASNPPISASPEAFAGSVVVEDQLVFADPVSPLASEVVPREGSLPAIGSSHVPSFGALLDPGNAQTEHTNDLLLQARGTARDLLITPRRLPLAYVLIRWLEESGHAGDLPPSALLPIASAFFNKYDPPSHPYGDDETDVLESLLYGTPGVADTAALAWVVASGLTLLQGDSHLVSLLDDDSWIGVGFSAWREFYDTVRRFWHVSHQSLPSAMEQLRNRLGDAKDGLQLAERHRQESLRLLTSFLARRPPFKLGTQIVQKAAQDWRWLQDALSHSQPDMQVRAWIQHFDPDAEITRFEREISTKGGRVVGPNRRSFVAQLSQLRMALASWIESVDIDSNINGGAGDALRQAVDELRDVLARRAAVWPTSWRDQDQDVLAAWSEVLLTRLTSFLEE